MITFKKFLEADIGNLADMGTPQQNAPMAPQATQGKQLNGALTDNQKRVLAVLSLNSVKSSPNLARSIFTGDQSLVKALDDLIKRFGAVDATPDGAVINQKGIELATSNGIVDANSGELSELGTKLAATNSNGAPNPKTKDVVGQPGMGQMPPPSMGGVAPGGMGLESFSLLKQLI